MIHDAAQILSTKIAMKKFEEGTDRGEMLIFQSFMHSWVCYECLKVLSVFGLQPTIRADIGSWSPQLCDLFTFYSDKTKNVECQIGAAKAVDLLFDSTDHCPDLSTLTAIINFKWPFISSCRKCV